MAAFPPRNGNGIIFFYSNYPIRSDSVFNRVFVPVVTAKLDQIEHVLDSNQRDLIIWDLFSQLSKNWNLRFGLDRNHSVECSFDHLRYMVMKIFFMKRTNTSYMGRNTMFYNHDDGDIIEDFGILMSKIACTPGFLGDEIRRTGTYYHCTGFVPSSSLQKEMPSDRGAFILPENQLIPTSRDMHYQLKSKNITEANTDLFCVCSQGNGEINLLNAGLFSASYNNYQPLAGCNFWIVEVVNHCHFQATGGMRGGMDIQSNLHGFRNTHVKARIISAWRLRCGMNRGKVSEAGATLCCMYTNGDLQTVCYDHWYEITENGYRRIEHS